VVVLRLKVDFSFTLYLVFCGCARLIITLFSSFLAVFFYYEYSDKINATF
jgi:hypothetical protein